MLDVGFSEILLTSAIALIVLGPERLPKVGRQVGNWMGRARDMARQLSEQLEREVSAEELLKTQSKPLSSTNLQDSGANEVSRGTHSPSAGSNGAAFDPAYAPSIAPPPAAPQPSSAPEPVHGLDAASTTAAAMHASDPPIANPKPADSHAAASDVKSPHE
jgi:sec-independent protein translocase protein TatB